MCRTIAEVDANLPRAFGETLRAPVEDVLIRRRVVAEDVAGVGVDVRRRLDLDARHTVRYLRNVDVRNQIRGRCAGTSQLEFHWNRAAQLEDRAAILVDGLQYLRPGVNNREVFSDVVERVVAVDGKGALPDQVLAHGLARITA